MMIIYRLCAYTLHSHLGDVHKPCCWPRVVTMFDLCGFQCRWSASVHHTALSYMFMPMSVSNCRCSVRSDCREAHSGSPRWLSIDAGQQCIDMERIEPQQIAIDQQAQVSQSVRLCVLYRFSRQHSAEDVWLNCPTQPFPLMTGSGFEPLSPGNLICRDFSTTHGNGEAG